MLFYGHQKWSFALNNGNAISNYAAYVYRDQAMTQLASLYDRADAGTAVPVLQPLIGDAKGFVNIYAPSGIYWIKVTSNGGNARDTVSGGLLSFADQPQVDPLTIEDSMDRWKGLELFDPSTAYYGAKVDGVTDDRLSASAAMEDMANNDGGVYLFPRGDMLVKPPPSKDPWIILDKGEKSGEPNHKFDHGYVFTGYGAAISRLVWGADWGNPMIQIAGRNGYNNDTRYGPVKIGNLALKGNGFISHLIEWWQSQAGVVANIWADTVKGCVSRLVTADYPLHENLWLINCGDPANSRSPIEWTDNDEGGTVQGRIKYGIARDIWIKGALDYGFYLRNPYECELQRVFILGTAAGMHGVYALDPEDCEFDVHGESAGGSILHIASTGGSKGSGVRGHRSGATRYGAEFFRGTEGMTHGPGYVQGIDGIEAANTLGDISVPLDGVVEIRTSAGVNQTYAQSPRPNWKVVAANVANGVTYVPDLSKGNIFALTATGATMTVGQPINGISGQVFTVVIINASGGATVVTWNAAFKFPAAGPFVWAAPANTKERSTDFRVGSNLTTFKVVAGSGGDI